LAGEIRFSAQRICGIPIAVPRNQQAEAFADFPARRASRLNEAGFE
jgi:hypothetical protein